jgi:acetyl-CoA acetyltransferase
VASRACAVLVLVLNATETSVLQVLPLLRRRALSRFLDPGGAAALVLSARPPARAVRIDAAVLLSGTYDPRPDLVRWETDVRAAAAAYERAGIGPDELDLVECHDAFSIAEILHYEGLGLCGAGEGAALAASGQTALGGRIPVNASGGLLSRGHPVAATGVAQIGEIALHLRGEAGERQVQGARVGLTQCMGGDLALDTKSCTVAVLSL